MRKDQRKLDKKRRKKLEEKKQKARQAKSLAYTGNKYRTEELVHTLMHTEIGIYETYIMTDRKLLDQTVVSGLEDLIGKLRKGSLPPLAQTGEVFYDVGHEEDLLIEIIRRNWAKHFATEWQPPKDKLIGVLRTILGSIETMKSPGPRSQSYMKHITGFLTKKLGVSVQAFSGDMKPLPEPEEDDLMGLGRQWYADGNPEARSEFYQLTTDLMRSGEAGRVVDACQLLVGEISDQSSAVSEELVRLSLKARESFITAMG